ncbi:MAG TPA: hypothetical protein VGQ37_27520 [Vicinamibacterales bacterium]|jgi:hypothetical protein|nr:hypothetical protein [Vicinamibacterales bacterium]
MRIPPRIRVTVTTVLATTAIAFGTTPPPQAQEGAVPEAWLMQKADARAVDCWTGPDRLRQMGLRPRAVVPEGTPATFLQEPPILAADYDGPVTLRDFLIPGDVATVRFMANTPDRDMEEWARIETRLVAGRLVSVFRPTWSRQRVDEILSAQGWGWDIGEVRWGWILNGPVEAPTFWGIDLRIAPKTLPRVQVSRLADDLQYSSYVVNIVMPGFANAYVQDDAGFDFAAVARRFYQDFEDSYDTLSMVPQAGLGASYQAFHRNVRNDVSGIGLQLFDDSARYGSASHRLHSVELLADGALTKNATSVHELAHQWGGYIDWSRLTGITRAGASPTSHDPLWTQGETLLGGPLSASRKVVPAEGGWQIGLATAPARFHPFTMYAMGLLSKEQVPAVDLFQEQGQFGATFTATPAVGAAVTGATRSATVFNVIGMIGERSGPVAREWHRAVIVVSEQLLTAREMDYWTFYASRLEDPLQTGVVGYDGAGSFDAATGWGVDLRTWIRPLRASALDESFDVDTRSFDKDDVRGVEFDYLVSSHYPVGQRVSWTGLVKAADRSDVSQILIVLRKYGGSGPPIRFSGAISARSTFEVTGSFDESQRGVYQMEVYLFWPAAGPQYSRSNLSPIVIE